MAHITTRFDHWLAEGASAKTMYIYSAVPKEKFEKDEPVQVTGKESIKATNQRNNYIYTYDGKVRLWSANKQNVAQLIDAGLFEDQPVDDVLDKLEEPQAWLSGGVFMDFAPSKISKSEWFNKFSSMFDGWTWDKKYKFVCILPKFVQEKFELTGGAMHDWYKTGEEEAPDWVLEAVRRFSEKQGRKFSPKTITWMRKNGPRPKAKVTLFRGMSFPTKMEMEKRIRGIKDGKNVILNLNAPSSWSTEKKVARDFAENPWPYPVLVSAEFEPNQILFDTTQLKASAKERLLFAGQNEVIVDAIGEHQAKII